MRRKSIPTAGKRSVRRVTKKKATVKKAPPTKVVATRKVTISKKIVDFSPWANRFSKMKIRPQYADDVQAMAKKALSYKDSHYIPVQKATGVPWYVVACADALEGNFGHEKYLGNGEPLSRKTQKVPKGRGPFLDKNGKPSWLVGAIDSMTYGTRYYPVKDFDGSVGYVLYFLEMHNGPGYYNKGKPSPYLWSYSDQYSKGKFIEKKDKQGKHRSYYDPNLVSRQTGAACLLKAMGVFDSKGRAVA
jgi:lysozyme family protein